MSRKSTKAIAASKSQTTQQTTDLQPENLEIEELTTQKPVSLASKIWPIGNTPNPNAHAAMINRAAASPQSSQQVVLQLQRQYGNRYVNRVLQQTRQLQTPIQAKLTLGAVGDKYEQEADCVAKQVVNQIQTSPSPSTTQTASVQRDIEKQLRMKPVDTIQREGVLDEENELGKNAVIQRSPTADAGTITPDLETSIQQARGRGQPLPDNIRQPMEQAFGANFRGVKVHTDTQSDRLNQAVQAKAFTTGQDIFFRQGEYSPGSSAGQELLAHELTHVVQQGAAQVSDNKEVCVNTNLETETEAEQIGEKMINKNQQTVNQSVENATTSNFPIQRVESESEDEKKLTSVKKLIKLFNEKEPQLTSNLSAITLEENEGIQFPSVTKRIFQFETTISLSNQERLAIKKETQFDINNNNLEEFYQPNIYPLKLGEKYEHEEENLDLTKWDDRKKQAYENRQLGKSDNILTRYLSETERPGFKITIDPETHLLLGADNKPLDTLHSRGGTFKGSQQGRHIFVQSPTGEIYTADPQAQEGIREINGQIVDERFHHSSFLAGNSVMSAGELKIVQGIIGTISDKSGHYLPTAEHIYQFIVSLKKQGAKLTDDRDIILDKNGAEITQAELDNMTPDEREKTRIEPANRSAKVELITPTKLFEEITNKIITEEIIEERFQEEFKDSFDSLNLSEEEASHKKESLKKYIKSELESQLRSDMSPSKPLNYHQFIQSGGNLKQILLKNMLNAQIKNDIKDGQINEKLKFLETPEEYDDGYKL